VGAEVSFTLWVQRFLSLTPGDVHGVDVGFVALEVALLFTPVAA